MNTLHLLAQELSVARVLMDENRYQRYIPDMYQLDQNSILLLFDYL